jgi:hypothetical protein
MVEICLQKKSRSLMGVALDQGCPISFLPTLHQPAYLAWLQTKGGFKMFATCRGALYLMKDAKRI